MDRGGVRRDPRTTVAGGLGDPERTRGDHSRHRSRDRAKGSEIDGASCLDERGPVIGISGRIPGLDSVLFAVLREMAHIHLGRVGDGCAIDVEPGSPATDTREAAAHDLASRRALPRPPVLAPPASRSTVLACSRDLGVHPAVVVGRLHHTGQLPWSHLNNLVPNARTHLSTWACRGRADLPPPTGAQSSQGVANPS
jgi:hypothetical protein